MTSTAPAELPCLKAARVGCELTVQVVPNAGRTVVAGLHDGALRVRVAAPPIEGRANTVLLLWLAQSLGLPRRSTTLISGDGHRRKRIHIDCEMGCVGTWLRTQLSGAAGGVDDGPTRPGGH